jgi:predicted SAM-dependent methyltransferase
MADHSISVRRLQIGGKYPKEGWEVLDAIPAPHVDHVGDASDLAAFPDDTFAEVYASHVLEHFDYKDEMIEVLREWRRVLKPGGTLYVSVPDLERLCRLYLQPGLKPAERYRVMRTMFGGHLDDYDYHMAGIDESYLGYCIQTAGFTEIRRVESFGLFQDDSEGELFGMRISLNMVAIKS